MLGQIRPAAVNQIDAGKAVLARDLLGAQVLLHRHWEIGAALDGGVVAYDHALMSCDASHPRDNTRRVNVARVHAMSGESSRNGEPGSITRSTRSRGSSLPRAMWRSFSLSGPPLAAWARFSARSA